MLWELCRIFKRVRVSYEEPQAEAGDSFQLLYAPHRHLPTEPISIDLVQIESAESSPPKPADSANPSPPESLERATTPGGVRQKGAALATRSAPKKLEGVSWEKVAMAAVGAMAVGAALAGSSTRALEGKLRVTLPSLVKVLPIRSNQRITLQSADIQDPEQSRQLAIIGELTNLFAVQMKAHTGIVVAGSNLSALLDALKTVSYTHLDVYKRQRLTRMARR